MSEIIEKFIQKLEKLDNYYILRQDKNLIVIATTIIIKEHKEYLGNIFQPRTQNTDKKLPIFFVITLIDNSSDPIIKEMIKGKFPILNFNKWPIGISAKDIGIALDQFVIDNFKN